MTDIKSPMLTEEDVAMRQSNNGSSDQASSEKAVGEEEPAMVEDEPVIVEPEKPISPPAAKKMAADKEDREPMVRIWFSTNRKTNEKGEYTSHREPGVNTYGHMEIELSVAQHHSPPKKSMTGLQYVKKPEPEFFTEIEETLNYYRDLGCTPQILVALHNYNVGFTESLVAAAHWHEDLNVAGPTISYSWPSVGKSGNYEPDAASMERSEPEISDFLTKVSALCGSENVHLVADGTACHGLLRVLQRMDADKIEIKIGQIFLLAPDVDRELFINLAWLFPKYSTRTTLYASKVDRDAKRSVKRHQAPRAGIFEPFTIVDGIDTIAIPTLETDDLSKEKNTRKFEIVTLLYDMYDLMNNNKPPRRRLHLTKQVDDGQTYWKLRKL